MAACTFCETDSIFVVGDNNANTFGLGHSNKLKNLVNFSEHHLDLNIIKIYLGDSFIIIKDINNNYYSCGSNKYGQCCVGHKYDVITPQAIDYFNNNEINITQISLNRNTRHLFWMDNKGNVYGNGENKRGQLGLGNKDIENKDIAVFIKQLNNVIDIKCAIRFSVALCASINDNHIIIIKYWCQLYQIPDDIINIIIMFSKYRKVYSTEYSNYGGNGIKAELNENKQYEWKEIDTLSDKNIIEIRTGSFHSLFLDSNGSLYGCGGNALNQLGLGHCDSVWSPILITNKIQIKDIKCGCNHTLIIDYNLKIWSWGYNRDGQCGNNTTKNVCYPAMIKTLDKYEIIGFECGGNHSFCKTLNEQHFMFGSNEYNECITFDERSEVLTPFCINDIIKEKCNGKIIKSICLGLHNTIFIVGNK